MDVSEAIFLSEVSLKCPMTAGELHLDPFSPISSQPAAVS